MLTRTEEAAPEVALLSRSLSMSHGDEEEAAPDAAQAETAPRSAQPMCMSSSLRRPRLRAVGLAAGLALLLGVAAAITGLVARARRPGEQGHGQDQDAVWSSHTVLQAWTRNLTSLAESEGNKCAMTLTICQRLSAAEVDQLSDPTAQVPSSVIRSIATSLLTEAGVATDKLDMTNAYSFHDDVNPSDPDVNIFYEVKFEADWAGFKTGTREIETKLGKAITTSSGAERRGMIAHLTAENAPGETCQPELKCIAGKKRMTLTFPSDGSAPPLPVQLSGLTKRWEAYTQAHPSSTSWLVPVTNFGECESQRESGDVNGQIAAGLPTSLHAFCLQPDPTNPTLSICGGEQGNAAWSAAAVDTPGCWPGCTAPS